MQSQLFKLCADSLRTFTDENCRIKLKAAHAHELAAAYFGYSTKNSMLADKKYPITKLDQAEIIVMVPDEAIDQRRKNLQGLSSDLPDSYTLGEAVYSSLFSDEWWASPYPPFRDYEKLAKFLVEENDAYQEAFKFYRDIPVHHFVDINSSENGVLLSVTHSHQASTGELLGHGETTINLSRVAGRIGFSKPQISVGQWTGGARKTIVSGDEFIPKASVHDFEREVDCTYRGEAYSVRDNGAVFRKSRPGKRKRPLDEKWAFGNPCDHSGYMKLAAAVVHRIVATAFHEEPPSEGHVVDHIDTNRRNNRVENLRWVTRLENVLLNPATHKKIVAAYGSIEAFFKNPQKPEIPRLLGQYDWMRTVSKEEALASRQRMEKWAKSGKLPKGGEFGEWLFVPNNQIQEPIHESRDIDSLTPGAFQRRWKWPCEFPACPKEAKDDALLEYQQQLTPGAVFSRNEYRDSHVISAEINHIDSALVVLCELGTDAVKPWANSRVTIENGAFCHENLGSYFTLEGAKKQQCLALGLPWEGGDSIDDYA